MTTFEGFAFFGAPLIVLALGAVAVALNRRAVRRSVAMGQRGRDGTGIGDA